MLKDHYNTHKTYDLNQNPLKVGNKVYHLSRKVSARITDIGFDDEGDRVVKTDKFETSSNNVVLCGGD